MLEPPEKLYGQSHLGKYHPSHRRAQKPDRIKKLPANCSQGGRAGAKSLGPRSKLRSSRFYGQKLPFPSFAPPGESLPLAVLEPPEKLYGQSHLGKYHPSHRRAQKPDVLKSSPQTAAREGGRVLKVLGPGANYGRVASMVAPLPFFCTSRRKSSTGRARASGKALWPKPPGEVPSQSSEGPKAGPY